MPHVEPLGPLYSQPNPGGIQRLSAHLLAKFPGTHSGGWYNPASSLSGGGPSPHRVTQALDVMCDAGTAARIIRYMVAIAEAVNLQQVIAWHEIVTVQRWSEGIRRYAADDHSFGNGHAHIHVGLAASRNFDVSWIGGVTGTTSPPPPPPPLWKLPSEEDDMDNVASMVWAGDGALHHFWVDGKGNLGHRWEDKGSNHVENLRTRVGAGAFAADQKPHVFVAPGGALVVGARGSDGTMNFYATDGHGGWATQTAGL